MLELDSHILNAVVGGRCHVSHGHAANSLVRKRRSGGWNHGWFSGRHGPTGLNHHHVGESSRWHGAHLFHRWWLRGRGARDGAMRVVGMHVCCRLQTAGGGSISDGHHRGKSLSGAIQVKRGSGGTLFRVGGNDVTSGVCLKVEPSLLMEAFICHAGQVYQSYNAEEHIAAKPFFQICECLPASDGLHSTC